MALQMVSLDTPDGVSALLGWDPATDVHDRRRMLGKEIIAQKLGCEPKDIHIEREAPRGFGYHTRLLAYRDRQELPIGITTASFRAATVVVIFEPGRNVGVDIRDMHPDEDDVRLMKKHSKLFNEDNIPDLLQHWVCVQAVLEADGRGVRVPPEFVKLDAGRRKGWVPDRNEKYALVDASRDGWTITIALGATTPA